MALEEAQAEIPELSGWKPVLIPTLSAALLVAADIGLDHLLTPRAALVEDALSGARLLTLECLLAVSIWIGGRDVARRFGGWGPAFGWRRPKWIDAAAAVIFGVAIVVVRSLILSIADGLTHGRAGKEAQNVVLHHVDALGVVVLAVADVVLAPLTEELMFRGLLLRTLAFRFGFWPAAVASTAIFAMLHTYEVHSLGGAVTLALLVAALGLGNCILTRQLNSLSAGILIHAAFNGLALTTAVYPVSH